MARAGSARLYPRLPEGLSPARRRALSRGGRAPPLAAGPADPQVQAAFRSRLAALAETSTGSSTRIARAVLLGTPLSIDNSEVTDKGSVNQRAVLEHRADLVERLYSDPVSCHAIVLGDR